MHLKRSNGIFFIFKHEISHRIEWEKMCKNSEASFLPWFRSQQVLAHSAWLFRRPSHLTHREEAILGNPEAPGGSHCLRERRLIHQIDKMREWPHARSGDVSPGAFRGPFLPLKRLLPDLRKKISLRKFLLNPACFTFTNSDKFKFNAIVGIISYIKSILFVFYM